MPDREPVTVWVNEIDTHPAALAWNQIDGARTPQFIEVLQKHRKAEIYRLLMKTSDGETIIAKRCYINTGNLEKIIYEEILPLLPISQLQYYGSFQENNSYLWLFVADAGKSRFSITEAEHRALAAHWLGGLHRFALQTNAAKLLPQRGPTHYFELMQRARENIVIHASNPIMLPEDNEVARRVLTQIDTLESNWSKLLQFCGGIPSTLAHGDFQPKNIHIKPSPKGDVLYALDWEMCGWANPLVDLAPARGLSFEPQVDMNIYLSIMQEVWSGLDMSTLLFLAQVGGIFRRIAAIYWSTLELSDHWVEGPIRNMGIFHKHLSHAMEIVFGREFVND